MKPLEDGLEDILERGRLPEADSEMGRILATHPDMKREVTDMLEISRLLRQNFRVDESAAEELAPAPGFYARVMSRIEADGASTSFWDFFVDPALGGRLVFASLALAILLFAASFIPATSEAEMQVAEQEVIESVDQPVLGAVLVADEQDPPVAEAEDLESVRADALAQLTVYNQ